MKTVPLLNVQLLDIRPTDTPGAFLLFLKIGMDIFQFRFTVKTVPVGGHDLQLIHGEHVFERTFLTGPNISRAIAQIVGQVATGEEIDLPVSLGSWSPDPQLNRNWHHDLAGQRLPQAAG
ncbi:hypothetical protein [Gloeobacter violaceus]|uniref:hypothetical protein n=1 Tax=Gloeobacter violaceus TaxID=33072 RepID=UPI0013E8B64A|nr:hypothetical protein [Gloeobacter violaceus]